MRELSFIILLMSALSHKVTAETKTLVLDDAPNTVDDLYSTCRDEMLQAVEGGLLNTELNATAVFKKAWNANTCTSLIPGGATIHTNALDAFGHNKKLREAFNGAVKTLGGNASVYNSDFLFKSLHFLLMDSLHLLKAKQCKTVYHGTADQTYMAVEGATVRFGVFITADLEPSEQLEYANGGTFFNITSCSAVNLEDNACEPDIGSWILSPSETFTVESVKKIQTTDSKHTEIILRSLKMNSSHDCYYFQRPTARPPTTAPPPRSSSDTNWLTGSMFWLMALSLSASLNIGSLSTNSD